MSEHITHVAICDDVRRLCVRLDDLPATFRHAWVRWVDASRMGGVTREADRWSARVIDDLRRNPADREHDRKLAFILGALTHRSIDRHMKPIFAHFKQAIDARVVDGKPINECTIYCDMLILKEVFGFDRTFAESLFEDRVVRPARPVQELLRTLLQRTLIHACTSCESGLKVCIWMSVR
jgi:hypothetical protein